jgi:hypothetical protein
MMILLSDEIGVLELWSIGFPLKCTRLKGIPMDAFARNQDEFNIANVEYRTNNFER